MSRILVTGSSGSIGTRLCESFLENNIDFIGLDLKKNKWNKEVNNRTVISDLRTYDFARKLPKEVDTVIHLAANSRVNDLILDPSLALENFVTLFNILEYSRKSNVSKFLFSSSREVYGNVSSSNAIESQVDLNLCESPYSASKLGGEALIQSYKKCFNLDFIIFRFSNVYGMYDKSNRVIPVFLELCKLNKKLVVYGKEKILDFVYIDDVIYSILSSIEKFDDVKNDVFNVAYGEGTTLVHLANVIKSETNSETEIIIEENRTGEVMKFVGDISKSNQKLSYSPQVSLEQGIIKAVQWYSIN
ncbi:MAG: nucleoside-diphosphate sugar epimerase [Chloroflexi bacterium]|nr:nucleoside-diphosphate sugar epimerase [Chloroflexota bacterium]|tara:strand:- start:445 stop:1353 length:909 start_codon:yes stop_codon:yes gene_type:complete